MAPEPHAAAPMRSAAHVPGNGGLGLKLADGVARLGLALSAAQQAYLLAYIGLLVRWNGVYNLTSVRNPDDMLTVHILDSLSLLPLIDELAPDTVLDVGSGAGLPGIPLAIARPQLHIDSVDAVAKKIGFQRQAKTSLKLANFHPHHRRVEALTLAQKPSLIVCRAYAEVDTMLRSFGELAAPGVTVLAMKGGDPSRELAKLPVDWQLREVRKLDVPFLGAERSAVVLQRQTTHIGN